MIEVTGEVHMDVDTKDGLPSHCQPALTGGEAGLLRRESVMAGKNAPINFAVEKLILRAARSPELLDITQWVSDVVSNHGVEHGQVMLFCKHTTAAVVVNEDEPLLHEDIRDFLEALASSKSDYRHDDSRIRTANLVPDHGRNAHAHLKCLILGCSVTLPIVHGKLSLGEWQRIFLLEMDKPKRRELLVQVWGV